MTLLGTSHAVEPLQIDDPRVISMKGDLAAAWYEVPPDQVLVEVAKIEADSGRHFLAEDVALTAEEITGIPLKRHCFTCGMRVLTPYGYVPIHELKVGDVVMSWDERGAKLVANRIAKTHVAENQKFGTLVNTPTGIPLEVTPGHKFLAPRKGVYAEIGVLPPRTFLRSVVQIGRRCEGALIARGGYKMRNSATVMTFSVENPPHNYVVEGLVVQNKPLIHL